jgi:N-acetylglutamate synthase-like GNAT family acetyltransferase
MSHQIEIVDFSVELQEHVKRLNYEWIEKYFRLEKGDIASLSNPQEHIIDQGGFIFYAKLDGNIVGTASLLKKSENVFELGKMAVSASAQGLGVGTCLMEHCIKVAREKQIQTLVLYSNTQLAAAIHLYQKYGFVEVELEQGLYERADIKMAKQLGPG